jgi:hypothetical protein
MRNGIIGVVSCLEPAGAKQDSSRKRKIVSILNTKSSQRMNHVSIPAPAVKLSAPRHDLYSR